MSPSMLRNGKMGPRIMASTTLKPPISVWNRPHFWLDGTVTQSNCYIDQWVSSTLLDALRKWKKKPHNHYMQICISQGQQKWFSTGRGLRLNICRWNELLKWQENKKIMPDLQKMNNISFHPLRNYLPYISELLGRPDSEAVKLVLLRCR